MSNLRWVDVHNSIELNLSIDAEPVQIEGEQFLTIRDAECEVVCLVPDRTYKDWNHAKTIAELLEWAAENYPHRNGNEEVADE